MSPLEFVGVVVVKMWEPCGMVCLNVGGVVAGVTNWCLRSAGTAGWCVGNIDGGVMVASGLAAFRHDLTN